MTDGSLPTPSPAGQENGARSVKNVRRHGLFSPPDQVTGRWRKGEWPVGCVRRCQVNILFSGRAAGALINACACTLPVCIIKSPQPIWISTLWWEVICLQDTDGERTGRLTGGRRAHAVEKTASPTVTFIHPPADSLFSYTRFWALTAICLRVYSARVTCGISAVPPLL